MKITIAQEPVVLSAVLYINAKGSDGLMKLVCFNRSAGAKAALTDAKVGAVFDILGHWEDARDGSKQYIVDVAELSKSEDEQTELKRLGITKLKSGQYIRLDDMEYMQQAEIDKLLCKSN